VNPIEDRLTQPDGLAERLRALRTRAGLAGKDLAERNGWQPSKVSRLETGKQTPSAADLEAWARACQADPAATQALLDQLGDLQAVHQDWRRRMRRGQLPVQTAFVELVRQARVIRHFETVQIPGLLQTPDYARRVLTEMVELHGVEVDDIDAAVAARMQRQQLLYDTGKQFEFLLTEPVLRWLLPSPLVMRGQLDRLQTAIGLPNVRFGIIPLGVPLAITPQNSFQLYDNIALVETFIGETTHRDDDAAAYAVAMERLWTEAVAGEDARRLIVRAADGLPADG
jgi:transcriptional regulator with XRE-family HTH domain